MLYFFKVTAKDLWRITFLLFISLPGIPAHLDKCSRDGNDLEIIRQRVIADLLDPAIDQDKVVRLLKTIRGDGSWPGINYEDLSRTGFQHSDHLQNMLELSRAYKRAGSPFYDNPKTKMAALAALDFWLANDFICENWWWNEMGTPNLMINTLLVLDEDLNDQQRDKGLRIAGRANLEASGARPGGDLIQIAAMLGKQALFRRDETVLERVVSVMADEIKVTTGRGLKPDMSFHHRVDNVICTLSYGLGFANAFSYWALKIAGTKFRFPEEATKLLIDFYLDGICKSMVFGKFPDPGAKNRELSRQGVLDPAGTTLPENLMKASSYRRDELERIILIRKGEVEPDFRWNRMYWHSEYLTHQRPGYFASVRMHSSRNHTMEQPHNEEGLRNHHVGDGSNFISVTGKEYYDIFPVWDWQKIPGTTTLQKHELPHWKNIALKGLTDYVGGVSDGQYGAATMDFKSAHDGITARKAWFFFDDEFVCLGAGITSESDLPVATTLNQCLLDGEVKVRTKKTDASLPQGKHEISQANWIHHGKVGYVFPSATNVMISHGMTTGSWRLITHQTKATHDPVNKEVFTLWIDHGSQPRDKTYEYIVVPASAATDLSRYLKDSPVKISGNTKDVQAVSNIALGIGAIVFYSPSKATILSDLQVEASNPCAVVIRSDTNGVRSIAISDPSHLLDSVQLKISTTIDGAGNAWRASYDSKHKVSIIDVGLPTDGYAGQSVIINVPRQ